MNGEPQDNIDQRIAELTSSVLAGTASTEEVATLRALLASGTEARQSYMRAVELHAMLSASHEAPLSLEARESSPPERRDQAAADAPPSSGEEHVGAACSPDEVARLLERVDALARATTPLSDSGTQQGERPTVSGANSDRSSGSRTTRFKLTVGALAAAILAAIGVANLSPTVKAPEYIGVLTKATDAQWSDGADPLLPKRIELGQGLSLDRGIVEVSLTSGVAVVMRGPADIDFLSPMRVRANRGTVRARVGEDARGFILETPTTDVTDLGTEFAVDVDDRSGATDVVVFEGSIDLQYVERGAATPSRNAKVARREQLGLLQSGEALRVDPSGAVSRIVSIRSEAFPSNAAPQPISQRPIVIESVRDNLRDPNATQYYEVVNAGLREDCRAYVDRKYEWNGVDPNGIPSYLLGADYVMTFNSDKTRDDIKVSVRLAMPAALYVLWDDRLPEPDWLTSRFELLTERIGVDEAYLSSDQPPKRLQVGAGNSIDVAYSVWKTSVREAGWIELGSPPALGEESSMYGIAATPLSDQASPTRIRAEAASEPNATP